MTFPRLLTAAALSTLMAGAAFAQTPAAPATHMNDPAHAPLVQPVEAPAADQAATLVAATVADPSAPAVVLLSSPTSADQAFKLKAGDPTVVTNGPVPDTAANRAKYGAPMSDGGRRTTPAGN